jgi:hypothetical protein
MVLVVLVPVLQVVAQVVEDQTLAEILERLIEAVAVAVAGDLPHMVVTVDRVLLLLSTNTPLTRLLLYKCMKLRNIYNEVRKLLLAL